jgi:hypothetical protein
MASSTFGGGVTQVYGRSWNRQETAGQELSSASGLRLQRIALLASDTMTLSVLSECSIRTLPRSELSDFCHRISRACPTVDARNS